MPSISSPSHSLIAMKKGPLVNQRVMENPSKEGGGGGGGGDGWSSFLLKGPVEAIDEIPTLPPPSTTYNNIPHYRKKNLDMCTETLGCETGAAFTCFDFPVYGGESEREEPASRAPATAVKRMRRSAPLEFPPPLTTLGGGDHIRLKSKREDGRLILLPFKPNVLEADRRDGRLVIKLIPSRAFDLRATMEVVGSKAEEEKEEEVAEETNAGLRGEVEDKGTVEGGERLGAYSVAVNGDVKRDCFDEELCCNGNGVGGGVKRDCFDKELSCNGGDEIGSTGMYIRPGRCKEEEVGGSPMTRKSNAILNWDALWVAST